MKYTVECKKYNTREAECYIGCFERMLTIIFKNVNDVDIQIIENNMEKSYWDWQYDFEGMCCEEFILEKLPKRWKNKIVAVIYESEDEENEENINNL